MATRVDMFFAEFAAKAEDFMEQESAMHDANNSQRLMNSLHCDGEEEPGAKRVKHEQPGEKIEPKLEEPKLEKPKLEELEDPAASNSDSTGDAGGRPSSPLADAGSASRRNGQSRRRCPLSRQ